MIWLRRQEGFRGIFLGIVFFGGITFSSILKMLGFDVNVTAIVPLLLSIGVGFCFFLQPHRIRIDSSVVALFLFSVTSCLILSHALISDDRNFPLDYILHKFALTVVCPICFVCGRYWVGILKGSDIHVLLSVIFPLSLFLAVFNAFFITSDGVDVGVVGSYYQYAGDALVVLSLIYFIVHSGKLGNILKIFYCGLVSITLVLVGSRASLVAFLASVLLLIPILYYVVLWVFGIVAIIVLHYISGFYELRIRVLQSAVRYFELGEADLSGAERVDYLSDALSAIAEHPILGNFGYDYSGGGYVHNLLDIWANFGLIPFLILIILIVILAGKNFNNTRTNLASYNLSPIFAYCIVSLIFFRHPENIIIFFSLGILSSRFKYESMVASNR